MKTAADKFEHGLRLYHLGAISSYELLLLANDARRDIGLAPYTSDTVHDFHNRIGARRCAF